MKLNDVWVVKNLIIKLPTSFLQTEHDKFFSQHHFSEKKSGVGLYLRSDCASFLKRNLFRVLD